MARGLKRLGDWKTFSQSFSLIMGPLYKTIELFTSSSTIGSSKIEYCEILPFFWSDENQKKKKKKKTYLLSYKRIWHGAFIGRRVEIRPIKVYNAI